MAEDMSRKPLLYYEKCPGCKFDQRKSEMGDAIPVKEFLYILTVVLCCALPVATLYPFLYFMIRDLHIAKSEEDIGYYAGVVGSSLMLGRALTSVLWGLIADRYGRKPVLLIGVASVVLFNTLFGLSTTYWKAVSTRFLLGSMNGLLGTIQAYASEICHREHQALSLSLVNTAWGMGMIIGPAIGGFFAQPTEKFPEIFSRDSLFGRFPYLLPCLCVSLFGTVIFVACFWLPETLHIQDLHNMEGFDSSEALESLSNECDKEGNIQQSDGTRPISKKSLLKNWPLMSAISVYCVFALHDMAYSEIFSLWAVSPREFGGLSYSTSEVGVVLSITGAGILICQTLLYPLTVKILGPINVSRIAAVLTVPLLSSYPFIAMLSGLRLAILINCASVLKNMFSISVVTGLFVLQNNAVGQDQRGVANGISTTATSLFRAFGPAIGGVLFSWSQEHLHASFLPGYQMMFFILNVIEVIALLMTFKPFLVPTSDYNL